MDGIREPEDDLVQCAKKPERLEYLRQPLYGRATLGGKE